MNLWCGLAFFSRLNAGAAKEQRLYWRTMVIQTRSGDDAVLPNLMLARREVTKFLTDEKWHAVSMSSPLAVFPLILRKAIPGYEDKSTAADRIQILKHMFAN